MKTGYKLSLALLAAAVAANLSCAAQPPRSGSTSAAVASSQFRAETARETRQADDLPDVLPDAAEKITQTVFPVPDILCAASPNAVKPIADHLEDTVVAALDDLRKPGHGKANMPGGPIVKVHAQGGILVFRGTWEQTELVRSTLQALKGSAEDREGKAREKEQAALRRELESSKVLLPLN